MTTMTAQPTAWDRTADMVSQLYLSQPELIQRLLERMGAQGISHNAHGFRCTCPLHNGDNNQNFAIWLDRGYVVWRCNSQCASRGNLVTLMMRRYHVSFPEAVTNLAAFAGRPIEGPVMHVPKHQLEMEDMSTLSRRLGINNHSEATIFPESWVQDSLRMRHSHFLTKGFSQQVLDEFEVGFVPAGRWIFPDPKDPAKKIGWFVDRISVPWRNREGQCIGFAGRRVDGQEHIKYQTFPGTRRALAVYGLHDPRTQATIARTHKLALVEGYSDKWRATMHGIHNVGTVGGVDITPEQISLLACFDLSDVVVFLDGDPAGRVGAARIARALLGRFKVRMAFAPDGIDPGDMLEREQFITCLRNTHPFHQ